MNKKLLMISVLAAMVLIIPLAGVQEADARLKAYEITMVFDNNMYTQDDIITITSEINYPPPIDAHYDIYNENGILVYTGVETMFFEELFYHTLIAGNDILGVEWTTGNYTAIGWYDANLGANATASFYYTVDTVPGVPTNLAVEDLDNGNVNFTWNPPISDGGSPITDYLVYYTSDDPRVVTYIQMPSIATGIILHGIESGVEYSFYIKAINDIGIGQSVNITII